MLSKRDELNGHIQKIEYRIEEIKYIKTIIERDARTEYGGILERLHSAEGMKAAVLDHEMKEMQKDIEKIKEITDSFESLEKLGGSLPPAEFLAKFQILNENIEYIVAKPVKGI